MRIDPARIAAAGVAIVLSAWLIFVLIVHLNENGADRAHAVQDVIFGAVAIGLIWRGATRR